MNIPTYSNDKDIIESLSRITGVQYSDEQLKVLNHHGGMCILACAGSGKALANGTGVVTPNGYKNVEQLKVGDIVYGQDGHKQKVMGVYPQGEKQIYTITFSNGDSLDVSKDHLWKYGVKTEDGQIDWKVGTTEEIKKLLSRKVYTNKERIEYIGVPYAEPVAFGKRTDSDVDVYTMVALALNNDIYIGEDDNIHIKVSDNNLEIVKRFINNTTSKYGAIASKYSNEYILSGFGKEEIIRQAIFYGIIEKYNEKVPMIPRRLLYTDISTRRKVLSAVVDTLGKLNHSIYTIRIKRENALYDKVNFEYSRVNFGYIKFILQSCGYLVEYAYHTGEEYVILVRLCIGDKKLHTLESLDKNLDREIMVPKGELNRIESIVGTSKKKAMTCIKVSNEDGLFLTENFVVTHNTTVLTHLIAKRLQSFEIKEASTLLCTTYSKDGAKELETRLNKLLRQVGINKDITVKTMHALYLSVLREFGYPSTVMSGPDRKKFLKEACKDAGVKLTDEDVLTLDSLISYQVNNLLKDADLVRSYAYTLQDLSLEDYSAIRKNFAAKKINAKVVDFDDMQLYMYSLLYQHGRQDIVDYCRRNWTDIYVDEAQDMSRIQYMILKKIITDQDRLVIIGDDDQCIYQWRGADPSIILNVCAEYDIQRFVLSTNYRCAGNIVERAAVGIKHNSRRSDKDMIPYNPGGDIRVCDCGSSNLYTMSKHAYKHIKALIDEKGVMPNQIAVLSRNNAHLSILGNMLFKDGIHCDMATEMKLSHSTIYKEAKKVIELASDSYNSNLTQNLWMVCLYLKKESAVKLSKIQNTSSVKLSTLLGYVLKNYLRRRDVDFEGTIPIPASAALTITEALSDLKRDTVENLVAIYNILQDSNREKKTMGLLALYITATEYKYKNNPDKMRELDGVVDYISDLIGTMGVEPTKQFLKLTEQYENGSMAVPGSKVCMSTMHGSKGREWDHVVLFADDNISFPSFGGLMTQLKDGISRADIFYGIDENRRLHYVAMTRARKELAIFTDRRDVGVFLLEAMGIFDYGIENNSHILSMAQNGEVYKALIADADKILFSDNSIYNYPIDISDINGKIEIDYFYRGSDTGKQTISLDDIQTGEAQKIGN